MHGSFYLDLEFCIVCINLKRFRHSKRRHRQQPVYQVVRSRSAPFLRSRYLINLYVILFSWGTLAPCFLVSPFHSVSTDILSSYFTISLGHPRPTKTIGITQTQNYIKIHWNPRPARLYLWWAKHHFCETNRNFLWTVDRFCSPLIWGAELWA